MLYKTQSITETKQLGLKLATTLRGGEILLLSGNLGTGKTVFIKGLGLGLGIKKIIRSPSFTILNHYKIKKGRIKNFVHLDCYRINDAQEIIDIGINDYLGKPDTIVAIEWPQVINKILKKYKTTKINFAQIKENSRKITIKK